MSAANKNYSRRIFSYIDRNLLGISRRIFLYRWKSSRYFTAEITSVFHGEIFLYRAGKLRRKHGFKNTAEYN